MCARVCMHACMRVSACLCLSLCMCVCVCVFARACMYSCVWNCVVLCLCVCVCFQFQHHADFKLLGFLTTFYVFALVITGSHFRRLSDSPPFLRDRFACTLSSSPRSSRLGQKTVAEAGFECGPPVELVITVAVAACHKNIESTIYRLLTIHGCKFMQDLCFHQPHFSPLEASCACILCGSRKSRAGASSVEVYNLSRLCYQGLLSAHAMKVFLGKRLHPWSLSYLQTVSFAEMPQSCQTLRCRRW
jgi:hypothetical protein